ncbi:ankyrin repeat-containing protein ITN1-like [Gossypium hirsutum]|uniref:Ankyrin repeat-containing protein ITN1-like n=1 Tax=Gossypium hirsutum TaxID=3635 RepID=A0A1U8PAE6_GOSHI|nr:ankyrin repeat-containing protein ITN1-like [Gossypium hirsutum]
MGANAVNETDLSALNMLLMFPSEGDHGEIMDILSGARALRARDMSLSAKPLEEVSHNGRIGELQGRVGLLSLNPSSRASQVSSQKFTVTVCTRKYSQGHVDFIREVLRLKPEYAKEVKRWFNPLHMAAANGHIEVVKELMYVDPELWSGVEGKGNKTRFHFAIMKGRINVINEMLSRYEGCIQCATVQRESALQLAVKDSSLKQLNLFLWLKIYAAD